MIKFIFNSAEYCSFLDSLCLQRGGRGIVGTASIYFPLPLLRMILIMRDHEPFLERKFTRKSPNFLNRIVPGWCEDLFGSRSTPCPQSTQIASGWIDHNSSQGGQTGLSRARKLKSGKRRHMHNTHIPGKGLSRAYTHWTRKEVMLTNTMGRLAWVYS